MSETTASTASAPDPAALLALVESQREAFRRFRRADGSRAALEDAIAAEMKEIRAGARSEVVVATEAAVKQETVAETEFAKAAPALTELGMLASASAPPQPPLHGGDALRETEKAARQTGEAAAAVLAAVARYRVWRALRSDLIRYGSVTAAVVVLVLGLVVAAKRADQSTAAQQELPAGSGALADQAAPPSPPAEVQVAPTATGNDEVPASVQETVVAQAPPEPERPTAPDPSAYSFAGRDLDAAHADLDQGSYEQVPRRLRGTITRLDALQARFPNFAALSQFRGEAVELMAQAASACEAEQIAQRQRGETPRTCT